LDYKLLVTYNEVAKRGKGHNNFFLKSQNNETKPNFTVEKLWNQQILNKHQDSNPCISQNKISHESYQLCFGN
jgi:hypothetical protein